MKFAMRTFYRVGETYDAEISYGFFPLEVEVREVAPEDAPVVLRHRLASNVIGMDAVTLEYRRLDDSLFAPTMVTLDAFVLNMADRGGTEAPVEFYPFMNEDWRFIGISRNDRGKIAVRDTMPVPSDKLDDDVPTDKVRSARWRAKALLRLFLRDVVSIDGDLWCKAARPKLIVSAPGPRARPGAAAKILPTTTVPFYDIEFSDRFRAPATYEAVASARLDDRLFGIEEIDEAKRRAKELARKVWMPDRFEVGDPGLPMYDLATSAMISIIEEMAKATTPEADQAFADQAFRGAMAPLVAIHGNGDYTSKEGLRAVMLAPLLRSALAAFGATPDIEMLSRMEPYASLLDRARRIAERTQERIRFGRTDTVDPTLLERPDDDALASLGP